MKLKETVFHLKISLGVELIACSDELMQLGALTKKLAEDVPSRQARQSFNITKVEELICSQEDAPGTHKSPGEIQQITGIARSSVLC